MNITYLTTKGPDSITVTATLHIEAGICVTKMPCVEEETLKRSLESYMRRGMVGFNVSAMNTMGNVESFPEKSSDQAPPAP